MTQNPEPQPQAAAGPTPPPPFYPYRTPPPEEDVNLLDLLAVLKKRWKLIAAVTLLGTSVAAAYALLATPIYRAQAVIAPSREEDRNATSSALAVLGGFGAEIASSLGISVGRTDATRLEALLVSHRVIAEVITKAELLPVLFEDDWDAAKRRWRVTEEEDIPSVWDAEEELKDIYSVKNDTKAGVLRLSFEWKDRAVATKALQGFLEELARVVQEDELRRIETSRRFIEEQLKTATDPVIIARLQSLLSEQVEKATMAQNAESLAYELIDPPAASEQEVSPNRPLIACGGFAVALLLGMSLAFLAERTICLPSPPPAS